MIVDTDAGLDDAVALLYLAGTPEVEIVAVTTVYGNTRVDNAVHNVARTLAMAGLTDVTLARGAAGPRHGEPEIADRVHGGDGFGDRWVETVAPSRLSPLTSAELLVDLGREDPGRNELLMLGPLTNLMLALEIEPRLLELYRSVVVMGGSGPFATPGEIQMSDSNVQNDPEAASRVFHAPRRHLVAVGVDVTTRVILDEEAIVALHRAGTDRAKFAAQLLESYMDFYQFEWGRRISPVHDSTAAAILVHPEWITASMTGPVNIVRNGYGARARLMRTTSGMQPALAVDPAPDTIVVTRIDDRTVVNDLIRVLTQPD